MGDTTLYLIPTLTPWEIQLFILYQPLHHGRYNPLSYTNPYTMGDTTLYLIPTLYSEVTPWEIQPFILYQPLHHGRYNPLSYTNPYTMGDTTLYLIPTLTPWEIQPFILYQPLHHLIGSDTFTFNWLERAACFFCNICCISFKELK